MKIQICSWNISTRSDIDKIITFLKTQLKSSQPTIFCLQEVLLQKNTELETAFGKDSVANSLYLRPPGKHEGQNRRMGVSTIAVNCKILEHELIGYSLFPERSQFVKIEVGDEVSGIVNFHSLTGVHYKKAKASNFKSIASFISDRESEIDFLCFDANEPEKDYFDLLQVKFYDNFDKGKGAAMIMGTERVHSLSDSLRSLYTSTGFVNEEEPLVISHINRGYKKRFDYIFHSPKWKVEEVEYLYQESIAASSDHAMVKGIFSL